MTKTINDHYANCKKELFDKVEGNPIILEDLAVGKLVKLWSGLNNKSDCPLKEERLLKENLFLIIPKVSNYFGKELEKYTTISGVNKEMIRLGNPYGIEVNYKFLEI